METVTFNTTKWAISIDVPAPAISKADPNDMNHRFPRDDAQRNRQFMRQIPRQ
jgi:hypothetical protein